MYGQTWVLIFEWVGRGRSREGFSRGVSLGVVIWEIGASLGVMKRLTQILTAVSTSIFASNALAEPLAMGSAVPVVEQKNQDDQLVKLAEVGAKGYLLVYFYPKADTPGCTKQACRMGEMAMICRMRSPCPAVMVARHNRFELPDIMLSIGGVYN